MCIGRPAPDLDLLYLCSGGVCESIGVAILICSGIRDVMAILLGTVA
jgi:hypothetical protein